MITDEPSPVLTSEDGSFSRRSALKKIGVVGAAAWVAPVIYGSTTSAAGPVNCARSLQARATGDTQRWNSNCGQGGRWNGQARSYPLTLPGTPSCSYNFVMDVGAPGVPGQGQADITNPVFTVYNSNNTVVAGYANNQFSLTCGTRTWNCVVQPIPDCVDGGPTVNGGCVGGACNSSKLNAVIICCPV